MYVVNRNMDRRRKFAWAIEAAPGNSTLLRRMPRISLSIMDWTWVVRKVQHAGMDVIGVTASTTSTRLVPAFCLYPLQACRKSSRGAPSYF